MLRWMRCCVLLTVLGIASVQAAQNVMVSINPRGQSTVKVGSNLSILCEAKTPLSLCRVEIPGENSMILSPGQDEAGSIEYYGEGLERGHCGAKLARIEERHNGTFKCFVVPANGRIESTASLDIIIAKPPEKPELIVSPYSIRSGRKSYKKGERMEVSCISRGGQPPANLSIFFGDEFLKPEEQMHHYKSMFETPKAMVNVSRVLDSTDNGKTLTCRATHMALDRPIEDSMEIEVKFPPTPQPTIHQFGLIVGERGTINVTVYANPRPQFTWRIGDENIKLGKTDESGRLQTSSDISLGRGAWSVILTIDNVQKSDTEKEYILEARNNEGAFEYRILLSTSSQPVGVELDAGSIIGIVIGVMALILAVFLMIFARATGRWCFAGRNVPRATGESDLADPPESVNLLHSHKSKTTDANARRSDTESGRYSRSEVDNPQGRRKSKNQFLQIFKYKKDKVSGADTDTVRTIVTLDEEKPKVEETKPTQTPNEGGIVYAELDLTLQQPAQNMQRPPKEEKTEYAEILYTKPAEPTTPEK